MRICFLSDPAYLHIQRWARYFISQGHDVHIIGGRKRAAVLLTDIKTHVLAEDAFKGPWILRTTLALKRLLDQIKPDILHMHYLGPLVAPILLRFKPFIVSVWGADIIGESGLAKDLWKIRLLKRLVLRKADAVLASSFFLAKATCQYASLPTGRVSTYYWGVDLKQFTVSSPKKSDLTVVGFVKHLLPKYGPEYLLRAIPIVREKKGNIRLLMIGEGALRQELENLTKDLRIQDIVSFCGPVEHEKVPYYLAQMNIFVMPSVYESETFGIAAIEAQAMGVPVIATKVGGIPEAVKDGITGILVPPRDPKSIAEAILKLISDKSLMESMSCEGPRFVAENFDWQKNAGRVEELYESLLLRYRK
jgi:glycosyltransferase involved in cell wall biosynthesis